MVLEHQHNNYKDLSCVGGALLQADVMHLLEHGYTHIGDGIEL